MAQARVSIGTNGRLVIPASLRREIGLREGGTLIAETDGRVLRLRPLDDVVRQAQEIVARYAGGRSLSNELIEERRQEAKREARRGRKS